MTYVVTETCIRCKYMDCVEVCPVDCFYVGGNMLVIHPMSASIAVFASPNVRSKRSFRIPMAKRKKWLELNRDYSEEWPNITRKGSSPDDADTYKDEEGKFEKYFDEAPGRSLGRRQSPPVATVRTILVSRAVTALNLWYI